jgi:hypothetical protein
MSEIKRSSRYVLEAIILAIDPGLEASLAVAGAATAVHLGIWKKQGRAAGVECRSRQTTVLLVADMTALGMPLSC